MCGGFLPAQEVIKAPSTRWRLSGEMQWWKTEIWEQIISHLIVHWVYKDSSVFSFHKNAQNIFRKKGEYGNNTKFRS